MTNEEAIEWFTMLKEKFIGTEYGEYLDMAIKALEQPEGDLISRQAVLDLFGDIHPLDYNARAYVAQIKELPSIKQADGDLISRDYVLSKFKEQCDRCGKYKENNGVMCGCCELEGAIDFVEDVPSAEKTTGWKNNCYGFWICTKCGYSLNNSYYTVNYCPNCGRRTKGVEE